MQWCINRITKVRHLLSNLSTNSLVTCHKKTHDEEVNYNNYQFEHVRLKSFKNWTCPWIKPEDLAAAGFYYSGIKDSVICFECYLELHTWQPNDDPMVEHQRWSNGTCSFVRNYSCGNVPNGADPKNIPSFTEGQDVCGLYNDNLMTLEELKKFFPQNLNTKESEKNGRIGSFFLHTLMPKYPEYASYDARLSTYKMWPKEMSQSKEELAAAGFFYMGKDDQTSCYYCGGKLKDWEPEDNPWNQHAKWFNQCSYLLMTKGTDYVKAAEKMQ